MMLARALRSPAVLRSVAAMHGRAPVSRFVAPAVRSQWRAMSSGSGSDDDDDDESGDLLSYADASIRYSEPMVLCMLHPAWILTGSRFLSFFLSFFFF
jgi:hypothetical protein